MDLFSNDDEKIKNEVEKRVKNELQKLLKDPNFIIQAYQKELEKAKSEIIELRPKAEFFEIVAESESLIEMTSVAKTLNFKEMGRNKIFEFLRGQYIVRYNNEPYQQYVDAGYFKVIEKSFEIDGRVMINSKTMVTQKGLNYIMKKLLENGYELNTSN